MSRDTWAPARTKTTVEALLAELSPWLREADGVTISGGEPFDQPGALIELLTRLRAVGGTPVLAYPGFSFSRLAAEHTEALALIDVLISEPFDARKPANAPLRGSANQQVHRLTAAGVDLWLRTEAE